jgi:hypothetical protein
MNARGNLFAMRESLYNFNSAFRDELFVKNKQAYMNDKTSSVIPDFLRHSHAFSPSFP